MLIPCIDLQGGQAVQLVHGRKRELAVADVYSLLGRFADYEWLHLIDLDAAMGRGSNSALVRSLCREARAQHRMKLRVGGGVRTVARARALVKLGVAQVIIGSAAFHNGKINLAFLRRLRGAVSRKRIVIALDTAKGRVTTHGWRRSMLVRPDEVFSQFEPFCAAFLCTDVCREGTMTGANLTWFRKLRAATSHPIIAAGGVCSAKEVAALQRLKMDAAVGMAIYKGFYSG